MKTCPEVRDMSSIGFTSNALEVVERFTACSTRIVGFASCRAEGTHQARFAAAAARTGDGGRGSREESPIGRGAFRRGNAVYAHFFPGLWADAVGAPDRVSDPNHRNRRAPGGNGGFHTVEDDIRSRAAQVGGKQLNREVPCAIRHDVPHHAEFFDGKEGKLRVRNLSNYARDFIRGYHVAPG